MIFKNNKKYEHLIKVKKIKDDLENDLQSKLNHQLSIKEGISTSKSNIEILGEENKKLKKKLSKARESSFIKRKLLGLDIEKIQQQILLTESKYNEEKEKILLLEKEVSRINEIGISLQIKTAKKTSELSNELTLLGKDFSETQNELAKSESVITILKNKINEIDQNLNELKDKLLSDAKLIATTLTKSCLNLEALRSCLYLMY